MKGDGGPRLRDILGASILATGCLAIPALAQDAEAAPETVFAEDDAVALGEMVVTASGFQQTVAEAPASISVIPREELETGTFRDLTDALRRVQGVTVTGTANERDIMIRGLPGQYTLILVDGVRQGTRESRTNGSAGIEQRNIPPLEAIERIEVLRGPASTLYGSDAVGGVINIITRPVAAEPTYSMTFEQTIQENSDFGNTSMGRLYGSVPLIDDTLGLQFWGSALGRDEDEILNGSAKREDYDIGARLVFAPNAENTFRFEGGATRLRNEFNPGASLDPLSARSTSHNDRDYFRLSQEGDYSWGQTFLSAQTETGQRTNFADAIAGLVQNERRPEVRNDVIDARAVIPLSFAGDHTLSVGGQYFNAILKDMNPGLRDNVVREYSAYQYGLFVEDEWWATNDFALTAGIRLDEHETYGTHFSPRLYGVYNLSSNFTLKGGVSTGFRAPDIRNVAPGYAYTTGGGGCFYGPADQLPEGASPCGVILASDDLQPETSTNYEAAVLYDNLMNFSAGATLFFTKFKDKISNERVYDANGDFARWEQDPNYTVWRNFNIDEAEIKGVELTASYSPIETVALTANYTYTDSEQKTGTYAGMPLTRTPKHAANVRVDWQTPIPELSTYAAGYYIGEQINAGLRVGTSGSPIYADDGVTVLGREYPGYFTGDIGATYRFNDTVALNAGIFNVADEAGMPEEYNDVVEGRRYWFSVSATF